MFWLQVGKSVSLTAILLSLAVYASKQAALHRVNERKARSFFLQVQAFDPFIEGLPEATKCELKQALSSRIFGAEDLEQDRAIMESADFKDFDRFFGYIEKVKGLLSK